MGPMEGMGALGRMGSACAWHQRPIGLWPKNTEQI